ncbi:Two component system response regulator/histidine kinase [Desulfonema magnum]|uniref:histidine kinase n=1 Tax=Desulfonema magnum TaxID=45655 RepID=A0A975BF57_9BACT|nr:Two component system response regulator/histidine kinase [Desulfonema magnum]
MNALFDFLEDGSNFPETVPTHKWERIKEDKKASVLIVDDNPTNLDILVDYLEDSGFKTFAAPGGERALQQLKHIVPDIILLDIMMPGINGFETCRQIKRSEATKDIPVIFMTALSETFDKVKGFYLGAVDYITKPFRQEEVLARITIQIAIRRRQKELSQLNEGLFQSNKKVIESNTRLSKLNIRLSQANTAKDKMLSVIAHDMKHIFSYLTDSSEMLMASAAELNNSKIEDIVTSVCDTVRDAHKLMENLVTWSDFEIRDMEFEPRAIDLRKAVSDCIFLFTEDAKQKGINLSHHIETDTIIHADLNMTDMIFRNLISNAVRFCDRGGEVKISALPSVPNDERTERTEEEFWEISVFNTGISISEEIIQNVFQTDENYKEDSGISGKGTGISLILCKELVKKNKGKIWVEHEAGGGTIFRFTLPKNHAIP